MDIKKDSDTVNEAHYATAVEMLETHHNAVFHVCLGS